MAHGHKGTLHDGGNDSGVLAAEPELRNRLFALLPTGKGHGVLFHQFRAHQLVAAEAGKPSVGFGVGFRGAEGLSVTLERREIFVRAGDVCSLRFFSFIGCDVRDIDFRNVAVPEIALEELLSESLGLASRADTGSVRLWPFELPAV